MVCDVEEECSFSLGDEERLSPSFDESNAFVGCDYEWRVLDWHFNPQEAVKKEIEKYSFLRDEDPDRMIIAHRIPFSVDSLPRFEEYSIDGTFVDRITKNEYATLFFPGAIETAEGLEVGAFEIGYAFSERGKKIFHRFFRNVKDCKAEIRDEIEKRFERFQRDKSESTKTPGLNGETIFEREFSVAIEDGREKASYILFKPLMH